MCSEISWWGDLPDHYAVTAATPQTAGVAFNTTVTAQDSFGQVVAGTAQLW